MYCAKCGSQVNENASFCGNCGNPIKKAPPPKKSVNLSVKNITDVVNGIKNYLSHFYVDYNSKIFKFAMILFLAIGIGNPLSNLLNYILPYSIPDLFIDYNVSVPVLLDFLVPLILFGIFSLIILNIKSKTTIRKSTVLVAVWIITVVMNAIIFFAGSSINGYILYSHYATIIVNMLMVISSVLLIFKNKPKYPIVLFITALSFALSNSLLWAIQIDIKLYELLGTADAFVDIFRRVSLGHILLTVLIFTLMYLVPRKVSKWLILIPALFIIALDIISFVKDFSFLRILSLIVDISVTVVFVLWALSCTKTEKYDYEVVRKQTIQKSAIKISVISLSSLVVIIVTYLLVSALVCSAQINNGLVKWKDQIINGNLTTDSQWSEMSKDVYKYSCRKFAGQFIEEDGLYEILTEHRYTMEKISLCSAAYNSGNVDDAVIEDYQAINVDESWADNEVLSVYYKKYVAMQPEISKVWVRGYVDVDNGEIEITVENDNVMPVSKCTVNCKFTIIFIKSGQYSDPEYGRGERTIEIESIGGKSKKIETVYFNPDDYYDSYGSYIVAALMDDSFELISIE